MPLPFHRRRLDPDAADFCRRSGATDRAAINAFVRGVKDLGLWNNMVCWPLRSTQNSGGADPTNTTVYSLGGLGTFNGTRVNGPTWGSDGIIFDSTLNQQVQLSIAGRPLGHQEVIFKPAAGNITASGPFDRGNGHHYVRIGSSSYIAGIFNGGAFNIVLGIPSGSTNWHNAGMSYGAGGMIAFQEGFQSGTNANILAGASQPSILKLGNGQLAWSGIIPFFADFNMKFDESKHSSFYLLYKSTLGTGLGLP